MSIPVSETLLQDLGPNKYFRLLYIFTISSVQITGFKFRDFNKHQFRLRSSVYLLLTYSVIHLQKALNPGQGHAGSEMCPGWDTDPSQHIVHTHIHT